MARKAAPPSPSVPPDWSDLARKKMHASGLLPFHAAKGADLDPSTVARWYTGEREMRMSSFEKLCRFLGLELCDSDERRRR